MIKMRYLITVIFIIVFATGSCLAQETLPDTVSSAPGISIESSVDHSEIYIGDLITYKLICYKYTFWE